jgi:hypothetical protein
MVSLMLEKGIFPVVRTFVATWSFAIQLLLAVIREVQANSRDMLRLKMSSQIALQEQWSLAGEPVHKQELGVFTRA